MNRRREYLWLCGVLSLYSVALLVYSQTRAFTWDETYHVLASQLIGAGRRPYIDFCFPQSPLSAYWDAAWMRVFGQSWHVAHGTAALLTIGAVILIADYTLRSFPFPSWRLTAGITAGLTAGLNPMVFEYAPLALGYGMCLFGLAAAFRISVRSVDRSGLLLPAAAGLCSGCAAGASLLSAAAWPVLLGWTLYYNRAGSRWKKLPAFTMGAAIPFAPVYWLFWQGPHQTWFNLIQYHLSFRRAYYPHATPHDLDVLTMWIDSGPALLTGVLAIFGLHYVVRSRDWPRVLKAEFYLCAWLAAVLSVEAVTAHPTFERYFALPAPFVAIPAAAGLYALSAALAGPERRLWPALLVVALLALGLGRSIYDRHDENDWSVYERLARKVDEVTPRDGRLLAEEPIYFLTRRTPPPGFELFYSHKINLPPADRALLHIVTEAEIKAQEKSGMFATAYSCDDDDIKGLKDLYKQRADIEDCAILWDIKK